MIKLKVFVSSPGDVAREREIARRVMARVENRFAGQVEIEPYLWEHEPLQSSADFQGNIPPTSSFDLVICILWTRLGTRLGPQYQTTEGRRFNSGTEFEVLTTIEAQDQPPQGLPILSIFLNKTDWKVPTQDLSAAQSQLAQLQKLRDFLAQLFFEQDEEDESVTLNKRAFNQYHSLDQFEDLLNKQIVQLIEKKLRDRPEGGLAPPEKRKASWKGNPYRGLEVFEFKHAAILYGRTRATESVLNALKSRWDAGCGFTLILGASGTGKSSLVRAGVLPLLIQPGVVEKVGLWRRASIMPGRSSGDAMDALSAALLSPEALPNLAPIEDSERVHQLAAELRTMPEFVADRIRDELRQAGHTWLVEEKVKLNEKASQLSREGRSQDAATLEAQIQGMAAPETRLVILVDQFEELFTSTISEEARIEFVRVIDCFARMGETAVIATMRSDFYASYQRYPLLINLAGETGRVDLTPPQPIEIGEMIRGPAEAAGLQFEIDAETNQSLDEALRDAAMESPEGLPLLEHVLKLLFQLQAERQDGWLRWEDYRKLGEFSGALSQHADQVLGQLKSSSLEVLDDVLESLITVGVSEESKPVRRIARYDLVATHPAVSNLIEAFVDARLFTTGKDEQGRATVSVAHEALLRVWPRITEWIEENRDFLQMRARLETARKAWEAAKEHPDFLLDHGRPLAEAEELQSRYGSALAERDRTFIRLSSAAVHRVENRNRRIRRTVLSGISTLALIAIGFAIFANRMQAKAVEERQATEAANLAILKGNARSAKQSHKLAEAALWDVALIEAKQRLGQPNRLDQLRLLALEPELDFFRWRLPSNGRVRQIVPRSSGESVFLNLGSRDLLHATRNEDGDWNLEALNAIREPVFTIAPSPGDEGILFVITRQKLIAMNVNSMTQLWEFAADEGEFSPALSVTENVWVWLGNQLLGIDPSKGTVKVSMQTGLSSASTIDAAVIDAAQGKVFAIVDKNHQMAWSLASGDLLFEDDYSGWYAGSLASHDNGIALLSHQRGNDELILRNFTGLSDPIRIAMHWDAMSVFQAREKGVQIVCRDGAIRAWDWNGNFLNTQRIADANGTSATAKVGDTTWVAGDNLSIYQSLDTPPVFTQSWWRDVRHIQALNQDRFLLQTRRGLEIRSMEDGNLLSSRLISADDVLVEEEAGLVFLRRPGVLEVYEWSELFDSEISNPAPSARVYGVDQGPMAFDGSRQQIAVPYNDGFHMFDAPTLKRSQRILNSSPAAAAFEPNTQDLWLANLDTARGRMEIFVHRDSGNQGMLYHPVHPESINTSSFQFSDRRWLLLGHKDGSAEGLDLTLRSSHERSLVIPEPAVKPISPSGYKPVASIHVLPNQEFLLSRSTNALAIFRPDKEGKYAEKRTFSPFTKPPNQVVPLPNQTVLIESGGELALFQLGNSMRLSRFDDDVGKQSTGSHAFCTPNGVVHPKDRTVVIVGESGTSQTLVPEKTSSESFEEVFVGPGEDLVLALDWEAVVAWTLDKENAGKTFFDAGIEPSASRILALPAAQPGTLTFTGRRSFAVAVRSEIWEIEVPEDGTSKLKTSRTWRPQLGSDTRITSMAKSGETFAVVDRTQDRPFLYGITGHPHQPDIAQIALPGIPRSLRSLNQQGVIAVGSEDEIFVVDVAGNRLLRRIELPKSGQSEIRPIEDMSPVPGSNVVLIGREQRISAVDWESGEFITDFPVHEFVSSIHVDPDRQQARWLGSKCHGIIYLPNFTAKAPTAEELEQKLGLQLRNGQIHQTKPPLRLRRVTPPLLNASHP
tara:strand:- start:412 stop:5748 length:5337 start_codon:yes stop_codon:yes gene_type:complete